MGLAVIGKSKEQGKEHLILPDLGEMGVLHPCLSLSPSMRTSQAPMGPCWLRGSQGQEGWGWGAGRRCGIFETHGVCAGGIGEGDGAAGARGALPRLSSQAPHHWWNLSPPADWHQPRSHWSLPPLGSWTPWFSLSASLCLPPPPFLSTPGPPSPLLSLCLFLSFVSCGVCLSPPVPPSPSPDTAPVFLS